MNIDMWPIHRPDTTIVVKRYEDDDAAKTPWFHLGFRLEGQRVEIRLSERQLHEIVLKGAAALYLRCEEIDIAPLEVAS